MNKFRRYIKKYYIIIVGIVILILLDWIPYKSGYFKSDIETFQNAVKHYNSTIAFSFSIIAILCIIVYMLTEKFKLKSKSDKLDFITVNSLYTIVFTLALILSIDSPLTDVALLINKQKSYNTIVRSYKIGYFDTELRKLVVLDNDFEVVNMNQKTFNQIKRDSTVQIKFKIGVFNIPFDPIFTKSDSN